MPRDKSYTTLHGDIEEVRIESIRFFGDWGEHCFIPISLIRDGEDLDEDDDVDIDVETWFVEKEGLG